MFYYKKIAGNPGALPSLDGLRAFAILLVLLRHGIQACKTEFPLFFDDLADNPVINIMVNGWAGVDLFFVLSGFLVGHHLLTNWPAEKSSILVFTAKYWGKRALRVLPLYYVILLIVVLDIIPLYQHSSFSVANSVIRHLVFLQDYFTSDLLVPLWSLGTEIKFYFLSPFLLWFLAIFSNKKMTFTLLGILSIVPLLNRLILLSNSQISGYVNFFWEVRAPFHMAIDGLLLGVIIAYIYHNKLLENQIKKYANYLFVASAGLLIIILGVNEWMAMQNAWQMTAAVLLILAVLFSVLTYASIFLQGGYRTFLSGCLLRYLAKLSYSLYLCHMLLIPVSLYLSNILIAETSIIILKIITFFVIYLMLSLACSVILHLSIEKPFLKLKDHIKLGKD